MKTSLEFQSGYFFNGLPFVKIGNKSRILVIIEALSFKHEPLSGFDLKQFKKMAQFFTNEYTVYSIGRKPNLSKNYLFTQMANDYADVFRQEFKDPVDIMGTSTGGQICHYLAGDHPDLIHKVVILSAAYKLSLQGVEIERKSADYFQQKKYGKSLAALMDGVYEPGLKRSLLKFFINIFGKFFLGKITYPNDYLLEVKADQEMNFKDRLNQIKAPTLIISGEKDIFYSIKDVKITVSEIPNARFIEYKNLGHNMMMSKSKEIIPHIKEFLNQ